MDVDMGERLGHIFLRRVAANEFIPRLQSHALVVLLRTFGALPLFAFPGPLALAKLRSHLWCFPPCSPFQGRWPWLDYGRTFGAFEFKFI